MKKFAILLSALAATAAQAEETLPFIVVESRPINAATDVDPTQATGPVRVIKRKDFENRTANLADVLSTQTGVQIRQSGGLGSYSSVSLRGSTARQVQVVVDGMLLNDPVTGGVDMGKLGLHDISRVQVYPGSAPAQFAHAGIGGVVVMETLGKDIEDTTRINLGAGSFDTYKTGVFNSGSHEDFYYWVSLDQQSSNNDFEYPNESDWFNPNDGDTTKRRNSDYEQQAASTKLGWEINDTSKLNALVQYHDNHQQVPSIQNWRNNRASLDNRTLRAQLHYQQQGWLDGRLHSSHRLIWSDIEERYDNRTGQVGLGTNDTVTRTKQHGMVNTLSWLLGNQTLSITADIAEYDYAQTDRLTTTQPDNRTRLQIATAIAHRWQSDDSRWRTQATVRHYQIKDKSVETMGFGPLNKTEESDQYTSWQLGLSRYLVGGWTLSLGLAQEVRIPTLQELYGQQGLFVGNKDLNAEESLNIEASLGLEKGWGHLEATGYFRQLDPAVVATYDARGVGRYTNLPADIYGTELDALLRLAPWWELYGSVTLQESENTDATIADRFEQRLPGIYHQSYSLGTRWTLRLFTLDLNYQVDDELYYDSANLLEADTRKMANMMANWVMIWPNRSETKLSLEVRNLTDTLYQDFNRFPGPGRSWFINLTHAF